MAGLGELEVRRDRGVCGGGGVRGGCGLCRCAWPHGLDVLCAAATGVLVHVQSTRRRIKRTGTKADMWGTRRATTLP